MAYKKTEAERAKDYFKRYLAIQNPRSIADDQIRFVVNNFNLEFVKLYNRTMEALMTEELKKLNASGCNKQPTGTCVLLTASDE